MTEQDNINRMKETLHPELAPYLRAVPIIIDGEVVNQPIVHHPLIVELAFCAELINRLYRQKRELAERLRAQGRFRELLGLYERPYRLTTLMEWIDKKAAPPDKLRETLVWAWIDAEDTDAAETPELVRVFRELRPADGSPIVDDAGTPIPPAPLEIYHGGKSKDSMSWTTERSIAEWFASRWAKPPKPLWAATVPPDGILALLSVRGEKEVVVDPSFLQDVKRAD